MRTRSKTLVLLSLLTLTTLWFCAGAALGQDVLTGLVSRWTFDNSGAIGADLVGANTGVGTNATYTAAGQIAGAVSFVGNGYVAVPFSASLGLNTYTISAWVKIASTPGAYGIMGTRIGGDTTFDLKVQSNYIHGDFGSGAAWIDTSVDIAAADTGTNGQGGQLTVGRWYMITYVVDPTAFRLYIDGDLKKTKAFTGTPLMMKAGQTLRIGEDAGNEYMNGVIDDARIYNRPLSTAEVLSVHNAGIVIPPIAFLANPFTVTRATAGQPYVGSVAATTNDNVAGDAVFSKTSGPAWLSIAANGAVTGTPGPGDVGGPFPVGIHVVSTGNTTTANATMNIAVGDGLVTSKILFVQGRNSNDLSAYKYFIANTVYPNANIIFSGDTLADKSAFVSTPYGALNPTQLARLNDADLVIFTPDLNSADYQTPDWALLNVPMLMHSALLSADSAVGWGWIGGYFENSAAMPSHSAGVSDGMAGDKWYGHEQWSTDSFFTGMTGHFVAANPDASGDALANWFPLFNTAGYAMGGSINSDSWGTGTILFSGNGSTQYNDKSFIVRWVQGNRLSRLNTSAASRRFVFNMGANNDYNAINGFLNPLTGANANGLLALQHAFTYLYNPANGRRPIPSAGTNQTIYILPPATTADLVVSGATYSDGNGGTAGTLAWTIKAVNPVLEGSETITAGAATLTPTFHFTKPGVFTATLRATNGTLDYVESRKTITVSTPTVPYIVSVTPPNGRLVPNLTAPVLVQFDHAIAYTPPLQLTVANGGSPVVFNGSSADNITFSFSCGALALSGTNTPISFSLDTSTVKDAIGGVLPFATPTYTWALIYNVAGARPIILCSNRTAASDTIYVGLLTALYGAGTPITVLKSTGYTATPWTPATSATLQNASLVILDTSEGLNDAQWNALRAPLMVNNSGFCKGTNIGMAPRDNNWPSQLDINAENYFQNPFFEGVAIRQDDDCPIATVNANFMGLDYSPTGSGGDTIGTNEKPNGTSLGFYNWGNFPRKLGMYWPKNTLFYATSTQQAKGRRLYALSNGNGVNMWAQNQLSPNGVQLVTNLHKYFAVPSGAPNVVWKDPAAKLVQKMTTVSIRFDRTVSAPAAGNTLTLRNQANVVLGTYGPAVASQDAMVWTYTIPTSMVGIVAQTFHFSVAMAGVFETESLYNIPFQGAAYTWDTAYDPLAYQQILFCSNKPSSKEDQSYFTWLQNVYGPNQSARFMAPYEFSQATWSAATVKAFADAALVVVTGSGSNSGHYNTAQWNLLANKMLILSTSAPMTANWGMAPVSNNWGNDGLNTLNPIPALFSGVTLAAGRATTFINGGGTQLKLEYGTDAAPTYNGVNYGYYRNSTDHHRVVLHYWAPNTVFYQGGTASATGPRMFFALDDAGNGDSFFTNNLMTADGLTLLKNVFYYNLMPAARPFVVSVTPVDGTLYTTKAPTAVTVTFNAPVTGVGALTVSGASGGTFTTTDNITFTWTPTTLPNVAGTVVLSLDTSAVIETGSGLNQPSASASYSWSFSFDQSQFQPKIALVSQLGEDHSQYVTFLTNDVYSTSLTAAAPYKRQAVVEDIPGKYYNMTAAGQTALENGFSLVVVMPFQDVTKLPGSRWNTVNLPIMMHNAQLPSNQNWQWGGSPTDWTDLTWVNWLAGPATVGWMDIANSLSRLDPLIQNLGTDWFTDTSTPPASYIAYWNSRPVLRAIEGNLGQGPNYINWAWPKPLARWDKGMTMSGGTAKTNRAFQSIGTTDAATNVVGFFDPTTGARDLGAKQVARNALRWLFSPDSQPFPVVVKSSSPPMNGTSGVLGPITVVFTKPVSGVLATDLTWNASLSAITYVATAATPAGTAPTDTWIFNGPWETDAALIGQYQPINITLNAMDTPTHSHIISVDGDGCPLTNWTWNYAWTPVPASVSDKLWTLYE